MERYLAALDVGTTSCKAALYDRESGQIWRARRKYGLLFPRPGQVEQNPDIWYGTVIECLAELVSQAAAPGGDIAAICISGTNGLVLVDELGIPVTNAVMFSDRRSERQAEALNQRYGQWLTRITGNQPWPGSFALPVLNWFREECPDLWQRVDRFMAPAGYVIMRLTGERTIDTSRASMTLLLDQSRRAWSETICSREGIDDHLLPKLFEPWEIIGGITPDAARRIGIRSGAPVLAGCVDSVAAAIGAGVISPDKALVMLGTTGRIIFASNRRHFDERLINQCHALRDQWLSTGAMSNAGGSLKWLVDTLAPLETTLESRLGLSNYQLVDMAAGQAPAGSNRLIFLPYLSGERSPLWNSRAKGVFFGLSERTVWPDMARSVLEGVAFALKSNLIALEQLLNIRESQLVMAGGGARSELWRRIITDVLERPVQIPAFLDAETLGGLFLAGTAVNHWKSVAAAVNAMARVTDRIDPNPDCFQVYRDRFATFNRLYNALLPIYQDSPD
jgi:xylulokinase